MQQPNDDRENYDSFLIPPATPTTDQQDVEDDDQPQAIQTVEKDGKRQLIGYAVVWNATSSPRRDGFRHRFQRGSIAWATPTLALWHHDFATPLGSTANQTVTVTEDDYGAKVTIDLDATTAGDDAFTRVKDRLVAGMSFGGRRIAYDRTPDPKVIDVTSFVADEASLTIVPAMVETNVVTADNSDELQKNIQQKKESDMRVQKNQLSKFQLALFRP